MSVSAIIPLVGQLLQLGFKIADLIEKSEDINIEDRQAMKDAVSAACDRVTYWTAIEDIEITPSGFISDKDLEAYQLHLNTLNATGRMTDGEYKANRNVLSEITNDVNSDEDKVALKASIDRTLRRYGLKVI